MGPALDAIKRFGLRDGRCVRETTKKDRYPFRSTDVYSSAPGLHF